MTRVEIKRINSLSSAHKIMCPFDIMLAIDNIAIENVGISIDTNLYLRAICNGGLSP